MKPVRLIIAVALLAVVGGALWWSNRDEKAKEGKPAADAPPFVVSIKPDDVKQLEIKRQGHDPITVVFNDKGKWDITAPKAYPADATAVAALTSGVFELPSERVIDPNVTDLAAHGLHHQYGIGRRRALVLLVGRLHHVHPILGHRTVARRVIDQLELAVAHVVVDRLGHADANELNPRSRASWATLLAVSIESLPPMYRK